MSDDGLLVNWYDQSLACPRRTRYLPGMSSAVPVMSMLAFGSGEGGDPSAVPDLNWAALAIPVFLLGVLVEIAIARAKGKAVYSFGTAMSDLAVGTVFQALEVLFNLVMLGAYAWLYEHWRLVEWSASSPWPWLIGMIGVDFAFYWWHRASHVVNVLWAVHGVHHQSEDYNLAVALRQPAFEPITWFFFYAPLALLGVSPLVYLLSYAVDRLYQFWIHTQLVDRLGPVAEYVLNTPSHHRVHHGVNERYLDKNYGAILILWDRWFGTFEPETEEVHYGTTIPLRSYDPVWGNLQYFVYIAWLATNAKTVGEKLWAVVAHPAWLPRGVEPLPKPHRETYELYRPRVDASTRRYVITQFVALGGPIVMFVLFDPRLALPQIVLGSTVIILSMLGLNALDEAKPWARTLERLRLPLLVAAWAWLAWTLASPTVWWTGTLGFAALAGVSYVWLGRLGRAG